MVRAMPVPVIEFVPQPSLEFASFSVSSASNGRTVYEMAVGVSATLWRNPTDTSDPANLAELDVATRRAIYDVPPWPRPAWLIEHVDRLRYPMLWEAVQTTWHHEESERSTLDALLVHHAKYILMNQFREELGLGVDMHDWSAPGLPSTRVVRHGVDVVIDGLPVRGAEIDTDPFVYAVGARTPHGGVMTAVIPREHLPYVRLQFGERAPT